MPDTHARLSASGSKKWINCPGSVQMESKFEDKPSEFAQEGTNAHSLGEAKIKLALKQYTRTSYHRTVKDIEITEDMEDYTDNYRDFVIERYNNALQHTPDAKIFVEQRLDFSKWVPDGFGTGDAVIVGEGFVEIIDLKYGKGVEVSAKDNSQLRLYALGALEAYDFLYGIHTVTMTIYQPRIDNVCSETIQADELYNWGTIISERAKLAYDDNVIDCVAGDYCDSGFCKARAVCRAYAEERQKMAAYDFKPPAELSVEEIATIIDQSAKLEKWAKLVSDYALEQALSNGVVYPGFKVVEGRSIRKYSKSDEDVGEVLITNGYPETAIFTRKLKGISEMEKLLGKSKFNELLGDLVIKPPGKPVLVHTEDKRPAINSAEQAANDFKNIIKGDD